MYIHIFLEEAGQFPSALNVHRNFHKFIRFYDKLFNIYWSFLSSLEHNVIVHTFHKILYAIIYEKAIRILEYTQRISAFLIKILKISPIYQ